MRAYRRTRHPLLVLGVVAAAALSACLVTPVARASDPRLQEAIDRRLEVQQRLDGLLDRTGRLEAEVSAERERLQVLRVTATGQRRRARAAGDLVASRIRAAYKWGQADLSLSLLTSGSSAQARERAQMLGLLAQRSRAELERVAAARERTDATAAQVAASVKRLRSRQAQLDAAHAESTRLVAQARSDEQQIRETIAAERRAAREEAARQRREAAAAAAVSAATTETAAAETAEAAAPRSSAAASRSGGVASGSTTSAASTACPVGQPRTYSDTWGAPRSGGRSHMGTDILAPHGTPSYAYEDGVISRMEASSLGGISLYLQGAGGASYYYTHLSGYTEGASVGKAVTAGEHIAYVGDSGNAAGISHLHFEVLPGGGSNVNPYPYVVRACG